MTPSVLVLRRAAARRPTLTAERARERSIQRRVGLVWGLLFFNTIGYSGTIFHIPHKAGQVITQGALPLALLVALTLNRKVVIRPNLFLCLVTLLPLEAILTALSPQFFGAVYRTFRLAEFVATLWLLTPWWGRRDLVLVRCHLIALLVILSSVGLGLVVAPGQAMASGRLGGALWDIPSTQVAHYAAITTGFVVVLWLCGRISGTFTVVVAVSAVVILVLAHTRTALVGMGAGILLAGLSLVSANARVRRLFVISGAIAGITILMFSSLIISWLARGEGTTGITDLTGRTKVWEPLLQFPRDRFQEIFGFGLSNSSFNGLPIDSNWISSYQEQGLFGVTVCAVILTYLLVSAYFQPRGVERALALFLTAYCLVASFTEDGFTDATPYLLELMLAASLLVPSLADRSPPRT
ncbi:MAG: hypothetical protein ACRDOK_01255 [Streptosporangiaceae bacterium]